MPKFQITFIPNHAQHEDDPCDFKEWKYVYADTKQDALDDIRRYASVIRCNEVEEYDD
jgi:hypothetical protein